MIRALNGEAQEQTGTSGWFTFAVQKMAGSNCPAGCGHGFGFSNTRIQRSSRRGVTMRCHDCGLQWTVTIHQLAKAARRIADQAIARGSEYADADAVVAERLESWAVVIGEKRGGRISKD
jgi:hypothetical protein